jgi:hypothetical protein
MNLLGGAGDLITAAGFRAAWTGVRWLPEPAAYALFDRIADVTVLRGGARRLRRTIARSGPT